ncbi:hypothetical protein T08_3585 [Trichinella sp. T8]|nr:hypothetical protein T08_3585 [Trichinella sp. T8]
MEIDEICTFEQEILEIRSIEEDFIEEMTDGKKAEIVKNGSDVKASVRLPRHELPKFHGTYWNSPHFGSNLKTVSTRGGISATLRCSPIYVRFLADLLLQR